MKKRTRDFKKHYRGLERQIKNFKLDFSEKNWYNTYHLHLDWTGLSSYRPKQKRRHLFYYLQFLDKIETLAATSNAATAFQVWIVFYEKTGLFDCLYLHTPNPYTSFPYGYKRLNWTVTLPFELFEVSKLNDYVIGELVNSDEKVFVIQKKGLGTLLSSNLYHKTSNLS